MSTQTTNMQAPDTLADYTLAPDALTPDTQTPVIRAADLKATDTQSTDTVAPVARTPDIPAINKQTPVRPAADFQAPDKQSIDTDDDGGTARESAASRVVKANAKRKPRDPSKPSQTMQAGKSGKPGAKSKKDQLIALLSKPNGVRISVIVERFGWQAHTARAALSGLRKQGMQVVTSKSSKTGETIYAIVAQPNGERGQVDGAAS